VRTPRALSPRLPVSCWGEGWSGFYVRDARYEEQALLALLGAVPVKGTDEGGPIEIGDLLVVSSTPGHAMQWDPQIGPACGLVGEVLEPMTGGGPASSLRCRRVDSAAGTRRAARLEYDDSIGLCDRLAISAMAPGEEVRTMRRSAWALAGTAILSVMLAGAGQEVAELVARGPIRIAGDEGFTEENGVVGGSGTLSDPFSISGWAIVSEPGGCGIRVSNVTMAFRIEGCAIAGSARTAVEIVNARGATVGDCIIDGVTYGMIFRAVEAGSVDGNRIARAAECGVYLENSPRIEVRDNRIERCGVGVCIVSGSTEVRVHGNLLRNCGLGVSILSPIGNNRIYRNDFVGCTALSMSFNIWNDEEKVGNYWSDYSGKDRDGDGIGDTPYLLRFLDQPGAVVTFWEYDYHPVMRPFLPDAGKTP